MGLRKMSISLFFLSFFSLENANALLARMKYHTLVDGPRSERGLDAHFDSGSKEWAVGLPIVSIDDSNSALRKINLGDFEEMKIVHPPLPESCELRGYKGEISDLSSGGRPSVLKLRFSGSKCSGYISKLRRNNVFLKFLPLKNSPIGTNNEVLQLFVSN